MNNKEKQPKEFVKQSYDEMIKLLSNAISTINDLNGVSADFTQIQNSFVATLSKQLEQTKDTADHILDSLEWDKLVIAFFGETNAGKSTIIETFRILFDEKERRDDINASYFKRLKNAYVELPSEGHSNIYEVYKTAISIFNIKKWFKHVRYPVDGIIVGDGRHDFTKTYTEYNMTIAGKPFVLIDVPGIEGNEDDYKEEIKSALNKAHCVYYVQGHNKGTETGTAEKIKKYLKDWVKVYSIYNVRGGADAYELPEDRKKLKSDTVNKVAETIYQSFLNILGNNYGGNIITQGLLAMASQANFSPKRADLIRKQNSLLSAFGTKKTMYEFCGFEEVVKLVEQKATNYTQEIVEANKEKLIYLSKQTIQTVDKQLSVQRNNMDRYRSILTNYKREIDGYVNTSKKSLEMDISNTCSLIFYDLKKKIVEIINSPNKKSDKGLKKTQMENALIHSKAALRESVKNILHQNATELNRRMQESKKILTGIPISLIQVDRNAVKIDDINIEINEIMEHFDINFEDVLNFGLNVGGGVATGAGIGSLFSPIGSIVGGILGGILGTIRNVVNSDGGVGKAQEEARKKIDAAVEITKKNLRVDVIAKRNGQYEELIDSVKNEVDLALTNFSKFGNSINEVKKRILNFENKIQSVIYGSIY